MSPFDMQITSTHFSSTAGDMVDRIKRSSPTSGSDESSLTLGSLEKPMQVAADKQQVKKKRLLKKKLKKPKDKPNRPLSAYNLFLRSERALMLGDDTPTAAQESLRKSVNGCTHGKITFGDKARAIGAKWKSLAPESKQQFLDQASKEKERYSLRLATWKDAQEENNDKRRLMMKVEVSRRNISMLQQIPHESNCLQASQDRQVDRATLFGLSLQQMSLFDSSRLQYPHAAEASVNAILQNFQGIQQSLSPQRQTAQAYNLFAADSYSQLSTSFPAKIAAMQRLQRYKMSNGSFT
jgi:hypothetical protein